MIARYAAGNEVPWAVFESVTHDIAELMGRSAEAAKIARDCRRYAETAPRSAPTDGRVPVGRAEIIVSLTAWWDRAWSDPVIRTHRSGGTVRRILGAIYADAIGVAVNVERLRPSGAWIVRLSDRQLAEQAGVGRTSVVRQRALVARHARRILDNGSTAYRLILRDQASQSGTTPEGEGLAPPGGGTGMRHRGDAFPPLRLNDASLRVASPSSDTWHRRPNAWLTWSVLDLVEPTQVADLATAVGAHRSTVYRALEVLRRDGLATSTEGGWLRVDGEEPVVPAFGEERKARHAAERASWRYRQEMARDADG